MTTYSFEDIVLVPFPFTDQSAVKKRPAIIASSDAHNRYRADIIVIAVTSQLHSADYFGDVAVGDWQQAELLKPSEQNSPHVAHICTHRGNKKV
jgi:mRNA interferase MazF